MNVDLADFYRGRLSLRRLMILSEHLPPRGAVARAIDPDGTRWGPTDYLLAQVVDTLHAAHRSEYRVPRPGSPEEKAAIAKLRQQTEVRARSRARFDEQQRRILEGRAG